MKSKEKLIPVITLIVGLILGSMLIFLTDYRLGNISPGEASKKVKDLYELTFGANVEIISVSEESNMYRVIARVTDYLGQTSVIEVYLSQDGRLVSDRVFKLDEFTSSLQKQSEFIDCLDEKGLKVYGLSTDNVTQIQVGYVLGGSRFLSKIYVDCDVNPKECEDAGIKVIPSIVYENKIYEGLKTLDWFENKTGCRFKKD
ncbi:MAG: hypothetical protein QMD36_03605 [Candidatus Aenigmarchaeota archaeon]|nr:hypothetical protein [Candidatus Aenigmarchaeota archaeon]